ncbi:MAG: hypothetical protein HY378_00175 [Candidatus Brennerbacteria bacterium]|nr:hypothetical protein [Candidatus Brennerbacteria bacterium]
MDQNRLKKLYAEQKLSSYQIASILQCSQKTVLNKLKAYKIPTRKIQEAKALTRPLHERKDFSGDPIEKAYLIGFRLGDLYVSKTHPKSPTIRVSTNTTRKEQLDLVAKLFSKYGYVKITGPDKRGATLVRCYLNTSFDFLLKKWDGIESWILSNESYFLAFLAGYTDAEGSFCICGGDGVFSIRSQDKNILRLISKKVNKMGILSKPPSLSARAGETDGHRIKNNRDAWGFYVYRKDSLLKLIELLRPIIKHQKRVEDMKKVENNIKRRNLMYGDRKDNRWYKTYKNYERAF